MRWPDRGAAIALAVGLMTCGPGTAVAVGAQTVTTTVTASTPAPPSVTTGSSTLATASSSSSTSQTDSTTTTATTTTSTTGAGETTSRDETLALLALLFGGAGVLIVMVFLWLDRDGTRNTFKATVATGQSVTGVGEPAGPAALGTPRALAVAPPTTIEGPSEVVVGVRSVFVAKHEGKEAVATWAVSPTTAAEISADPVNHRLLLVAKEAVPFTVTATVAGAASAPKQITARAVTSSGSVLPFLGAGWGAVVVAIVLASVTAALGFAHALSTDAVATILGALVGYVVAKSQGESGGEPSGSGGGKAGASPPHSTNA